MFAFDSSLNDPDFFLRCSNQIDLVRFYLPKYRLLSFTCLALPA